MKDCIFCNIARGDISCDKIYENKNFFSIKDIHPLVKWHSLVISKKHFQNILDIPDSLGSELIDCIKETLFKLKKEMDFEGFNVVQSNFKEADQEIFHIHFHIIPRRKNDSFELFSNSSK